MWGGGCRDGVLDTVLQIAEALSLAEEGGAALAGNNHLFLLACHVLRLKEGIGPAGISATVLIANLLAEDTSLVHHLTYGEIGRGQGSRGAPAELLLPPPLCVQMRWC